MVGKLPENRIDRPLVLMRWRDTAFVHWPYDPAAVSALLPPGLHVDCFEGRAWVGLVAFEMRDVRAPGTPPIPGLSTFPEINVRTYVRTDDGRDGLWFLTLEASRLLSVLARPAVGIFYAWADMSLRRSGNEVRYASRRRFPRHAAARTSLAVRPGAPIPPDEQRPFDHYLTGRWRAFSYRHGRLFSTPVEHEPWPLSTATLSRLDDRLVAACGLPQPDLAPLVHYAPQVNVRLGRPRPA